MATREKESSAKIDKLIGEVRTITTSMHDKVQEAGVAIIVHSQQFGDCSRARHLARAVPSRLRNMLVGWFALYSPIGIRMGRTAADDKCDFNRKPTDPTKRSKYHDFDVDGAKANMWYDDPAKVAPEPKPLDTLSGAWDKIDNFFKRLLDDAQKEDEKAKYRPEDATLIQDMANDLRQMLNRYRARQLAELAKASEPQAEEEGAAPEVAPKPAARRRQAAAVH